MKKAYMITGWFKQSEEDVFFKGCKYGGISIDGSDTFRGETIAECVSSFTSFCGSRSKDDVLLDSCEEEGRIDVQVMETEDGLAASTRELEQWKEGKLRLWISTYTGYLLCVERISAS